MPYSGNDITLLKTLLSLLRRSFKGASFGSVSADDCADALERVIKTAEAERSLVHPGGGIPIETQPDPTWEKFRGRLK